MSPTSVVKMAFNNVFNLIPINKEKIVADAIITGIVDTIMNLKIYATKSLTPLEYVRGTAIVTKPSSIKTVELEIDDCIIGARMFFQGNVLHTDLSKKLLKKIKNYGNESDLFKALKSDLQTDNGKNALMKELINQIGELYKDDDDSWDDSEEDYFESDDISDFIDNIFTQTINLGKENIGQIPGIGVLVIDEQNLNEAFIEKLAMSFEINRLNVGIEMFAKYDLKVHRYIDEE